MVRDGICGESANGSKNGRSHFKLMLCCLLLFIRPHIKFHQNRMKNTEVENFLYWSVLVGRAGRSKNACRHLKLFLCCFWSNISPHTKFHQNRTKNTEVKNFHLVGFGWSGWQVKNWSQAFLTYSMLFLVHYQPPHQISSKSDEKHRS